MTKRQVVRELRDVMDGASAHTFALVEKTKKGWEIETSICRMFPATQELNQHVFQHCCNEITLKEVEQELNRAFC